LKSPEFSGFFCPSDRSALKSNHLWQHKIMCRLCWAPCELLHLIIREEFRARKDSLEKAALIKERNKKKNPKFRISHMCDHDLFAVHNLKPVCQNTL
jgi:hypothetical protein